MAGSAIGRGARFTIFGLRMGPDATVRVSQRDRRVTAKVITANDVHIDALMPEDAPLGQAALMVTYCGRASVEYPITIAEASGGLFSANTRGWGPANMVDKRWQLITKARPVRPGRTVAALGTGFGSLTIPTEIFVAGRLASNVRRTPSPEPGIERIEFTIPKDTAEGCYVPVQARSGGDIVSNSVTLAVARNGPCRDPHNWMAGRTRVNKAGLVVLANFALDVAIGSDQPEPIGLSAGLATFREYAPGRRPIDPMFQLPPPGACITQSGRTSLASTLSPDAALEAAGGRALDAGPRITIESPAGYRGDIARPADQRKSYTAVLGVTGNLPAFLSRSRSPQLTPGEYTLAGEGGSDVGAFRATVRMPAPLKLLSPPPGSLTRAEDLLVRWESGPDNQTALVILIGFDRALGAYGLCACVARAESGQLKIPAITLSNIPATAPDELLPVGFIFAGLMPIRPPQVLRPSGVEEVLPLATAISGRSLKFR